MYTNTQKTGLVLSGGGAKGAYQAGVLRALAENGIHIDGVAGASIGALNGAIVAASPNLNEASKRLAKLWQRLAEVNPLQFNSIEFNYQKAAVYAVLLGSAGLRVSAPWVNVLLLLIQKGGEKMDWLKNDSSISLSQGAVFTDQPLQEMFDEFLDIQALQKALPLYVSVFEQENYLKGASDWVKAQFLGIDNPPSRFEHIQSLPLAQQKETLLASAALPLLFKSRIDESGGRLTDGGQGGWVKAQGNTPVTPLVNAGYETIIVSHLDNGALWHREDFPNTTFVEIRPNPKLDLTIKSTLDFSAQTIESLQNFGYEDTLTTIGKLQETFSLLNQKRKQQIVMEKSLDTLDTSTQGLQSLIHNLPK